jgi:hypothetical protein
MDSADLCSRLEFIFIAGTITNIVVIVVVVF